MAAIDVTGYVDLTLYDVNSQDIVERAVEHIATDFPEWEPLESDMAMVIVEGVALEVAETVYALNRVPGAVVEILLRLFGLTKDEGAPATASATFTVTVGPERTIPAGTTLLAHLPEDEVATFTTDADLVIAAGDTTGTVAITADTPGVDANGIAAGTRLDVVDTIAYVEGAVLAAATSGGRDVETDADYLDRGVALLSRLTTTLVLPQHFTAAALDDALVVRATTLDLYNPDATPPTPQPGHVTVAVLGADGATLTAEQRATVEANLEAMTSAAIDVHVIDAAVQPIDVTATVTRTPDVTDEQARASVEAALRAYLDPDTWAWSTTVYRNELVAVIDRAPGVARVVQVDPPAADVPLTGPATLATAGTITVTVQGVA